MFVQKNVIFVRKVNFFLNYGLLLSNFIFYLKIKYMYGGKINMPMSIQKPYKKWIFVYEQNEPIVARWQYSEKNLLALFFVSYSEYLYKYNVNN